MKIRNSIILITGASSGIGRETARQLAQKGAYLILAARRLELLKELKYEINATGGHEPVIVECDITDPDGQSKLEKAVESAGGLHILINNAGITAHGRFEHTRIEVFRRSMELNFFSVVSLTQRLLPYMKRTPGKKMIAYVSTPSALYGIPERSAYSTSKAAGNILMESIRMEHTFDSISTLAFCPGYTETELRTSGLAPDGSIINESQAPGARTPESVAAELIHSIESASRISFTDMNGRAVYWLRTLAPSLLEKLINKKVRRTH